MWIAIVTIGLTALLAVGVLLRKTAPKLARVLLVLTLTAALVIGVGTAVCWSAPETADADYDYARESRRRNWRDV